MLIAERPILTEDKANEFRLRSTLEPLGPGFGYTLGSSLRHTLLSPVPGTAVTSIHINDVAHELHTIESVKEDVVEIIFNIKQIVLSSENDEPVVTYPRKAGPDAVTAGDITPSAGIKIRNPELTLATLSERGKLEIKLTIECGRGYMSAAQNKDPQAEISQILIDSTYSPVVKVTYKVEAARVGQHTDFGRLAIDVEAKPAITSRDALASTGKTLVGLFGLIHELNGEAGDIEVGPSTTDATLAANLALPIESLNLQSHSYNALRRRGILTVDELTAHSEADLLDIRNFGTKSTEEIKEVFARLGMALKGPVMPDLDDSDSGSIRSSNEQSI